MENFEETEVNITELPNSGDTGSENEVYTQEDENVGNSISRMKQKRIISQTQRKLILKILQRIWKLVPNKMTKKKLKTQGIVFPE